MIDFLTIEIVLAIAAITWHYGLFCGFVSDDHATIERRKDIIPEGERNPKKEAYWRKVFNDGPVLFYLNRVMWKIVGQSHFAWHLLTFCIHIANTYLFYLVASTILEPKVALFAALIWTINPMQNQIAVWCSGRPYGIAAIFSLICLLYWHNPFIVLPFYLLAIFTNVSVILLPILIKLLHPLTWQGNLYIGLLLLAIPWLVWKFVQRFGKGALVLDRQNYQFSIRRMNNIARVYMYYLFACLFPVKMGWYHQGGFRYNTDWDGFNIWALGGYGLIVYFLRESAGVWFLLGMLPNMNIFATNSYLQDRYIYFGSMGLALLVAPYLAQWPVVFIALAATHAVKSYTYSRHMANDEKLYRENWRNHPNSAYAVNNLGFFLIQQNRAEEARAIIQRGIDLDKKNKLLWYNLGITWAMRGSLGTPEARMNFMRALDCWKMALQLEPRWRKPKEDIDKLVKYLIDNKVLTAKKSEAAPNAPPISMPAKGVAGT